MVGSSLQGWLPGVLLLAAAAGCKQTEKGGEAVVRLGPAPVLTCKPEPQFRWLDALGHPYSETFRKEFSYKKAEVEVRFPAEGPAFRGSLAARKLKPNFAYQMKLVGMPPFLWGRKGDADANRRIGEVGRWWIPGKDGRNAYFFDTEKDDERARMEGYLVFGYFVTDAEGKADVSFAADSSYHVLWKTSQWPAAASDSRPTHHVVVAEAGRYGYDRTFAPGDFELYAEAQYGRPAIGTMRLPAGRYRCFLLLTEESFHDYTAKDGGDWAAALAAVVEFTITPGGEAAGNAVAEPGVGRD